MKLPQTQVSCGNIGYPKSVSASFLKAEAANERKQKKKKTEVRSKPLELHSVPRHAELPFPPPAQTTI